MKRLQPDYRYALAVLLVAATVLIGWGIWRIAPHQLNGDEWSSIGKSLLMLFHEPVMPRFRKGGNFHLRLLAIAFLPLVAYWWATGSLPTMVQGTAGYASDVPLDPGPVLDGFYQAVFVGRLVSVLAAVATVYLAYRLTREVADRRAGLIAALTLVAMPGFVTLAKFANEDAPQFFLILLTLYLLVLAVGSRSPRTLALAAVVFGLAVSMKATSGLLLVPFALALHAVEWRNERSLRHLAESAGLYSALASIAYFATTPSALIWPDIWGISILSYIGLSVTRAPMTSGVTYGNPVIVAGLHYTRSMGALLAAVSLLAAVTVAYGLAIRRYDRRLVLPLSFAVVYGAVMLTPRMPQYPRLVLLHPFVAIVVGVTLADGLEHVTCRTGLVRYTVVGLTVLSAAAIVVTLVSTAVFVADFGTSRAQAADWLDDHADPGDEVDAYGYRVYAPEAPTHASVRRPLLNDPTNLPARERAIERVGSRCPRFVVLSSYYYGRFLNSPERSLAAHDFVRRLLFGVVPGYEHAARFGPPPIRDYSDRAKFWRSFNYPPTWLIGNANPTIVILERSGEREPTC